MTTRDRTAYLNKIAWSLAISPADIEDAVQEAHLAIWRKPEVDWRFVARSRMIDCARKWYGRKRRGKMTHDHAGEKRNHTPLEDVPLLRAADQYEELEDRLALAALIRRAKLSMVEAAVIEGLRRGDRQVETALALGKSPQWIAILRRRALGKLRKAVA